MADEPLYVLMKRGLYYRHNGEGYSGLLREAGRFREDDAFKLAADNTPDVTAVPVAEADEFAPSIGLNLLVSELRRQRDNARSRLEDASDRSSTLMAKLATQAGEAKQVAEGYLGLLRQIGNACVETGLEIKEDTDLGGVISAYIKSLAASASPRRVRHKKRGSLYSVLGTAEMQVSTGAWDQSGRGPPWRDTKDGDKVVVYRGDDGRLWVRFPDEFEDGRFEEVPPQA